MLFARLSVIIAVLLRLPVYLRVRERVAAVMTRGFISISQFAITACQ